MSRGGKRSGAGAKPGILSETIRKNLDEAIRQEAKEAGTTWEKILARILVRMKFKEGSVGIREWLAASSMYLQAMVEKRSHKEIEITDRRVVILPEIKRPKEDEVAQA